MDPYLRDIEKLLHAVNKHQMNNHICMQIRKETRMQGYKPNQVSVKARVDTGRNKRRNKVSMNGDVLVSGVSQVCEI